MPEQQDNDPFTQGIMKLIAYAFYLVIQGVIYLATNPITQGFLALFVLIMIFGKVSPEHQEQLAFPILFVFIFAIFWTIKNIWRTVNGMKVQSLDGIFFGYSKRQPVGKNRFDDGHVLVVGGAGSGKSSCIAIPTLKNFWNGRFLAVDIKGELAEKSDRRAIAFNPANPNSIGYDPFYLLKNTDNPSAFIRDIALTIAPMPPDTKDHFWIQSSQSILTGHLLFSYHNGASFIQALKTLQSTAPQVLLETISQDAEAGYYIRHLINTKLETLAGIMSELSNHIIPFVTDKDLEKALTKKNIITPDLLENGHDIFLQLPEHKLTQWKPLITLIIQQFLSHFERRVEESDTPILFLLDEFPRFGKIDGILNGLATLRSKKITICIIIQSLAQLDAIYGTEQRKIIADNCGYKAVLGATDADTQKYFSLLVGTSLQKQRSYTVDEREILFSPVTSSTTSFIEKATIKPEDLAYLKQKNEILLLSHEGHFLLQKRRYDQLPQTHINQPKQEQEQPAHKETSRTGSVVNFHGLVNPRSLSKLNQEIQKSGTFEGLVTLRGFRKSNKDTPVPLDSDPPPATTTLPPRKPELEPSPQTKPTAPTPPTKPTEPLAPPKKYKPFRIEDYDDQPEHVQPTAPASSNVPIPPTELSPRHPEPAPPTTDSRQANEPRDALGELLNRLNVPRQQSDYDPDQDPYDQPPRKRKR